MKNKNDVLVETDGVEPSINLTHGCTLAAIGIAVCHSSRKPPACTFVRIVNA